MSAPSTESMPQIRKAQSVDAGTIADFLRSLGLFRWVATESVAETRDRVARHLSLCLADESHSVYLAHASNGTLAGYCAVHWLPYLNFRGPEGFVSELFIGEQNRGQGIGTALLEAVKTEALERGCERLMLVNLRERESYRRGFYRKAGWEERKAAANFIYRLP